jgi:hypothetical protein
MCGTVIGEGKKRLGDGKDGAGLRDQAISAAVT